ncbi:aminotransferase class V-fold PLP-dependent enzyme [Natronospora cellulosivora (SeqCode)]
MLIKSPYRQDVLGVDTMVPLINNKISKYINFDNAATTPPLKVVMEALNEFAPWYSSIHRGKGYKSLLSSKLYEEAREIVANFVNADLKKNTIIFLKNTTEAINKIAYRYCQSEKKQNCVILSTDMEHHSNDLPWRDKYTIDYINIDNRGLLSLEDLESKLIKYKEKTRLVTVSGASNVTGYINPLHKIAGLCHQYGAKLLVDGAQLVPHEVVRMKRKNENENIDFLVFSAHKMYAPFGIGVLIGPKEFFNKGEPEDKGGGTVKVVTHKEVYWDNPPYKDEAGTPNIMGVVALTAAIKKLQELGMRKISTYEEELTMYTLAQLKNIPEIDLYNYKSAKKVAIIPFNIKGLSHEKVAKILAEEYGIGIRNGCFCAQPYIQKLLKVSENDIIKHIKNPQGEHPGLLRISLGMYNEKEEVDYLLKSLNDIINKLITPSYF